MGYSYLGNLQGGGMIMPPPGPPPTAIPTAKEELAVLQKVAMAQPPPPPEATFWEKNFTPLLVGGGFLFLSLVGFMLFVRTPVQEELYY